MKVPKRIFAALYCLAMAPIQAFVAACMMLGLSLTIAVKVVFSEKEYQDFMDGKSNLIIS